MPEEPAEELDPKDAAEDDDGPAALDAWEDDASNDDAGAGCDVALPALVEEDTAASDEDAAARDEDCAARDDDSAACEDDAPADEGGADEEDWTAPEDVDPSDDDGEALLLLLPAPDELLEVVASSGVVPVHAVPKAATTTHIAGIRIRLLRMVFGHRTTAEWKHSRACSCQRPNRVCVTGACAWPPTTPRQALPPRPVPSPPATPSNPGAPSRWV